MWSNLFLGRIQVFLLTESSYIQCSLFNIFSQNYFLSICFFLLTSDDIMPNLFLLSFIFIASTFHLFCILYWPVYLGDSFFALKFYNFTRIRLHLVNCDCVNILILSYTILIIISALSILCFTVTKNEV